MNEAAFFNGLEQTKALVERRLAQLLPPDGQARWTATG